MADNFFGITDVGKMRDNNEDRFIAQHILQKRYVLACVIDGVGGYEGGEIASALAHDSIINYLQKPHDDVVESLKHALIEANEKIIAGKQNNDVTSEMACVITLAVADVEENKFYYAHVGDTRLYLLRDNSLVKVTKDHSFVGFLEDNGRLSEEEAMTHPKRNEINKALGFNEQDFSQPDYIETGESPFLPGDILLLCSDGLSDMLNNKSITFILTSNKNLKEKGKALIKAANDAGGKDNITAVLVKNDKLQLMHEATKPVAIKKNETKELFEKIETADAITKTPVEKPRQKSPGFLIFICLVLLALVGWFVYKDYLKQPPKPKAVMPLPPQKIINADEQKLVNNLSRQKDIFLAQVINVQPLIFNDSVFIDRDSVHIHGNGSTIVADSSYNSVGFIFSENCKYILIDSLTLQNFNVAIIAKNNALHLKDVQFKNCKIAVQHEIVSNDKTVSGKFTDSLSSSKKDSVKIKYK